MLIAVISLHRVIMFIILAVALAAMMFNMIMFFAVSRLADKAAKSYPNNREMRRGRWAKTAHRGKGVGKYMRQVGKYSSF